MTTEQATHAGAAPARRVLSYVWALLPLLLAIPAAPCLAWAAHRLRSRLLAAEAALYGVLTITFCALAAHPGAADGIAGGISLALMAVATARCLMLRRRVFFPDAVHARLAVVGAPAPADWTPTFPATSAAPPDPNRPATWLTRLGCTGHDKHLLSVSVHSTIGLAVLGLAMTAVSLRLHVTGRGLGTGIGLMLAPLFAALFSRRVEGPLLYYRSWGVEHALRLDAVTSVATTKGPGLTLLLNAPGLRKPVRVAVANRAFSMSPSARDHLRGWLEHPGAQVSPAAQTLLDAGPARGATTWRAARAVRWIGWAAVAVTVVAVALLAVTRLTAARRGIPGASGYYTASGPAGKPFPVGRPWGVACGPIQFAAVSSLPDDVYGQFAAVVAEARRDGLNVTLADRSFRWSPALLRYPLGVTAAQVPRVVVYDDTAPPPHLSGGRVEHVAIGWDTRRDGAREDLTYVQARLHLVAFGGDALAERTAFRQIVAFTQGVSHTTRADSGIKTGTRVDEFTAADVHAMSVMSGCAA